MSGKNTAEELFVEIQKGCDEHFGNVKKGTDGFTAEHSLRTLTALNFGLSKGMVWLLRKVEKLEALPFEYAGVFEQGKAYRKNHFVTHGGRVWACVTDGTVQVPSLSEDWKLAVNKGRDGRDAKDLK